MNKLSWSKILNLNDKMLFQSGEDVIVVYSEKKEKKSETKKKLFIKKKHDEALEEWLPDQRQGNLIVDIYEDEDKNQLFIESIITGTKADDIDITVEPDLIIIRGQRKKQQRKGNIRYYSQECFWGKFSRTIILPCRVVPSAVNANLKNGILTISLSKEEDSDGNIEVEE